MPRRTRRCSLRDYAPEEIAEISRRLRQDAGLSDEPIAEVAAAPHGVAEKVKDKLGS